MEYLLVTWPRVQELMNFSWFRKECYLLQANEEQEHLDSAYFVPKDRLQELDEIYDVILRCKNTKL